MQPKPLLFSIFAWLSVGALHVLFTTLDRIKHTNFDPSTLTVEVVYYLGAYASWAVVCYFVFQSAQHFIAHQKLPLLLAIYVLGLAIWLPLFFIIDMKIGSALGLVPNASPRDILVNVSHQLIFFYAIVYTSMFGCCSAIALYNYSKKMLIEKLEIEKQEAQHRSHLIDLQMKALQSQLSPHFLFNSLGSVSALVRKSDKNAVISAIARLGDMLRFTVENSQNICISIEDEVAFVDHYIALQTLRFTGRFHVTMNNSVTNRNVSCPPFALHLLVENAFIHSVNACNSLIDININIVNVNEQLSITVSNTSVKPSQQSSGLGSGLRNLEDRLNLIYGGRATLETFVKPENFEVTISMPSEIYHD